jgi:hypothetical protein
MYNSIPKILHDIAKSMWKSKIKSNIVVIGTAVGIVLGIVFYNSMLNVTG